MTAYKCIGNERRKTFWEREDHVLSGDYQRTEEKNQRDPYFDAGINVALHLFLVDRKVRPIIKNNAAIQAKMIATKALNQAITEQLRDKDYTYDTMVKLGKDNDGQIISMETNTAQINEIQAQLTENAIRQLETIEDTVYKIRFGTLLFTRNICSAKVSS